MTDRDDPTPVAALEYARPSTHLTRGQRAFNRFHRLGGWRQLALGVGCAFVTGAFGYAYGHRMHTLSETPVCAAFGGLLIGLAIPVKRLK